MNSGIRARNLTVPNNIKNQRAYIMPIITYRTI